MLYGREHGFVEHSNLVALQVQFMWHVRPDASTIDMKRHFQFDLNELNPESFDERVIFMSMFNDTEWTEKGNAETCLHNAQKRLQPNSPASENTWWNGNSNERQGNVRYYGIADD